MFLIYLTQIQLQNASVTIVNFDLTINFSIKLNAKNIWDPILLIVLSWNPKSEIKLAIGMLWICCSRAAGAGGGRIRIPPPHFLSETVTLFKSGGSFCPPHYYTPPLDFQTYLRPCAVMGHIITLPFLPNTLSAWKLKIWDSALQSTKCCVYCM